MDYNVNVDDENTRLRYVGISLNVLNLSFIEATNSITWWREYSSKVRIIDNSGINVELYWISAESQDIPDGN
jgi:hypothetical protein